MKLSLLLVWAVVLGCAKGKTNELPAEAWGTADYARVGLHIDKVWTPDDYANAASLLQEHASAHRERLPRFRGEKSGAVFAKLVTDLPDDPSVSIQDRFGSHFKRGEAANAISKLYVADATATPSREWIELMGANLRVAALLASHSEAFLASFGPDDPNRDVRIGGLAKMKVGYGSMLLGGLLVADQLRLSEDDRVAMLAHVAAALPALFPFSTEEMQRDIRDRLTRQVAAYPGGRLHDAVVAAQRALPQ